MSDIKTMPDIEVGDFLLSRDDKQQGIVSRIGTRYCAACGRISRCATVRWPDGKITRPCTRGTMERCSSNGGGNIWRLT